MPLAGGASAGDLTLQNPTTTVYDVTITDDLELGFTMGLEQAGNHHQRGFSSACPSPRQPPIITAAF
jgi:hypothetical protein